MKTIFKDEWTQSEYLTNKNNLAKEGINVLLIDTILSPIDRAETILYNPIELAKEPKESVFVFYCDSGKASLDRLNEYRKKFPNNACISLKGGRGYWRKYMDILDD